MKFLLIVSLLLASNVYGQEIPNGDLENWEWIGGWYENPDNWQTMNNQVILHTEKLTTSCEQDFAIKVKPLAGVESMMGSISTSFPINSVPAQLNFCVQTNIFEAENFTDTCRVKISFWDQDIQVYEEVWENTSSISEWQEINLALNQIEPVISDCKITVESSFPGIGLGSGSLETWISVDDFNFDNTNAILTPNASSEVKVYPNPSVDGNFTISSDQKLGQIMIYDLLGNLIITDYENSNTVIISDELATGVYIINVQGINRKLTVR